MLIKKTFQGEIPENKIVNTESNSQTDAYSCNEINKHNTYSTDEVWTGKYWIDNKKIYSKVVVKNNYSASSTTVVTGVVSNMETLVDLKLIRKYSDGNWFHMWKETELVIRANGDFASSQSSNATFTIAYIIIEYTKTTD